MQKIALLILACSVCLAKITHLPATPANIASFSQILDVRTQHDLRELGSILGATAISLSKDKQSFIKEVHSKIDITKPFAIICRNGGRSEYAAKLLDNENALITNLKGGIDSLLKEGYMTIPYKRP